MADKSSRITYIQAEWMLEKCLFDRVLQTLKFSPTIDLFPSRLNHQLPTCVSYKPDPNAYVVDAFSLVWKQFRFYCFPPFTECLHYRMHYRMSPKNKERREWRSPDSTLLAHPTILLPAVANAKTRTNDNRTECKIMCNLIDSQLKSQIAAKTDLMAYIVSNKKW